MCYEINKKMVKKIGILGAFLLGLFLISVAAAGTSFDDAEVIDVDSALSGVGLQGQDAHYYKISLDIGDYFIAKDIVAYEEDGAFYDGSKGVYFEIYNPLKQKIASTVIKGSAIKDYMVGYSVSSEDDVGEYYFVIRYKGGGDYTLEYGMDFSVTDVRDINSVEASSRGDETATEIESGTYTDCCSLIRGDVRDTYRIEVKENSKITAKVIPESGVSDNLPELALYFYEEDQQKVSGDDGSRGETIEVDYVSPSDQTIWVYVTTTGGNDDNEGRYSLEVSVDGGGLFGKDYSDEPDSQSSSGSSSTPSLSSRNGGSSSGLFVFLIIILAVLIPYVYFSLCFIGMAKKTDVGPRWFAWVPILNLVLLVRISGMSSWLTLLIFVPIVNIVFFGVVWWKAAKRTGFSGGLGLLMFVPIAQLIMPGIFAWKKSVPNSGNDSSGSKIVSKSATPSSSGPNRGFDIKSMKKSYMLLGALGVLAISILLPWVSISVAIITLSISGWMISWIVKILLFVTLGVAALVYFKKDLGAKASVGLSAIILLYLVFRLIVPVSVGSGFASATLNLSSIFSYLGFGFYLFVIATVAVGVFGWKMKKARNGAVD